MFIYFKDNNLRILELLNQMYDCKYNQDMYSNLNIKAYLYNSIYVDKGFNDLFKSELGVENIDRIIPKGYFSKNYKQKYNSVVIITNEKEERYIVIDGSQNLQKKMN